VVLESRVACVGWELKLTNIFCAVAIWKGSKDVASAGTCNSQTFKLDSSSLF